jgi:hypothetical protein
MIRASRSKRSAALVLALGLALLAGIHLLAPGQSLPLYDGFLPEDPYRFLDPPPGQLGDPGHASQEFSVKNGRFPLVSAFTDEYPPQAQIFALKNVFAVPKGATSAVLSIDPVKPPQPPPNGWHIVGNVYALAFSTSDGKAVEVEPGQQPSVVLRGIAGDTKTTMYWLDGGRWKPLKTSFGGGTMRMANIDALGDFALMAEGPQPTYPPVPQPSGSGQPSESVAPTAIATASPSPQSSPSATPSASPSPASPSVPPASPSAAASPSFGQSPSETLVAASLSPPPTTAGPTVPPASPAPVSADLRGTGMAVSPVALALAGIAVVALAVIVGLIILRRRSR